MKKELPPGVKGIAFFDDVKNNIPIDRKRMTFGEFMKLPPKQKGKINTITYWVGHSDGPEFNGGAYYEIWLTIKINGRYHFHFLAVEKVLNSGKTSYVSPTAKNSDYKEYM